MLPQHVAAAAERFCCSNRCLLRVPPELVLAVRESYWGLASEGQRSVFILQHLDRGRRPPPFDSSCSASFRIAAGFSKNKYYRVRAIREGAASVEEAIQIVLSKQPRSRPAPVADSMRSWFVNVCSLSSLL